MRSQPISVKFKLQIYKQINQSHLNIFPLHFLSSMVRNMCEIFSLVPSKKPVTRENWEKLSVYFSIFEFINFDHFVRKHSFEKKLRFEILAHKSIMLWAGILNFKFRIVFLEYFFLEIGRFEKWMALPEKRPPLVPNNLLDAIVYVITF